MKRISIDQNLVINKYILTVYVTLSCIEYRIDKSKTSAQEI